MSSATANNPAPEVPPRRRLQRDERYRQLMDVARRLVREEGTDALTLGRLAEQSNVAKPVVYNHFGTRPGLLAALYREFDDRQTEAMDAAFEKSEPTLPGRAGVIAAAYVGCVLAQGRELPGVTAALASSPELEKVRQECEAVLMEKCRAALAPFAASGAISQAGLRSMFGAAEALSYAAANGEITEQEARDELLETIVAMVTRSVRGRPSRAKRGAR
jgi:AcrR family transcriptional regulator